MSQRAARTAVVLFGVAGVAVLASAAVLLRPFIETEWALSHLQSEDAVVRRDAIEHLARLAPPRAAGPLVRLFEESTSDDERSLVARALRRLGAAGSRAAAGSLRRLWRTEGASGWPALRKDLRCLHEGGVDPAALVTVLAPIVQSDFDQVRREAVAALPELGRAAIPVLVETLGSHDGPTRRAAGKGLATFGGDAALPVARVLAASDLVRARVEAAMTLAAMGTEAAPAVTTVREMLDDPERMIRGYAAEILETLGEIPAGTHVVVRASSVEAYPGSEAVIEFRGDVRRNVLLFSIRFEVAGDIARFVRSEESERAAGDDHDAATIFHPTPLGGGWECGVDFGLSPESPPLRPGSNVVLVRAVLRVKEDAPPGDYAVGIRQLVFLSESSETLSAETAGEAVLRVLPPLENAAGRGAPKSSPGANNEVEGEPSAAAETAVTEAAAEAAAASGDFAYHVEDVQVKPGDRGVVVRVLATASSPAQGFGFALRVDPEKTRLRKVSADDTVAKTNEYDQFLWQRHVLDRGVTAVGCLYDTMEGRGRRFPAGEFQHAASLLVDIAQDTPEGACIRVDLGEFGDPPHSCMFTITDPETRRASSQPARDVDGWILVGESPVPAAEDFDATRSDETGVVKLTWKLASKKGTLRLERDGVLLKKLAPGTTEYLDRDATRTALEYRLRVRQDNAESFPATARVGGWTREGPVTGSNAEAREDAR